MFDTHSSSCTIPQVLLFSPIMLATYLCAVCGEEIETVVDPSQGDEQQYIEDCEVCCRPNVLTVHIDPETEEVQIESVFEE